MLADVVKYSQFLCKTDSSSSNKKAAGVGTTTVAAASTRTVEEPQDLSVKNRSQSCQTDDGGGRQGGHDTRAPPNLEDLPRLCGPRRPPSLVPCGSSPTSFPSLNSNVLLHSVAKLIEDLKKSRRRKEENSSNNIDLVAVDRSGSGRGNPADALLNNNNNNEVNKDGDENTKESSDPQEMKLLKVLVSILMANHDIFRSNQTAPEIVRHNISFGQSAAAAAAVAAAAVAESSGTFPPEYSVDNLVDQLAFPNSSSNCTSSSSAAHHVDDYFVDGTINTMLRNISNSRSSQYMSNNHHFPSQSSATAAEACSSPSSEFSTDYGSSYTNDNVSSISELISPFNVSSYAIPNQVISPSNPYSHFNHTYARLPESAAAAAAAAAAASTPGPLGMSVIKQEIKTEANNNTSSGKSRRNYKGITVKKESGEFETAEMIRHRHSRDEKRARELGIPFNLSDVIQLPMDEFNDLLSRHDLTEDQLNLCRDIRRRGKNKVAAQNCRKRKIDQICELQESIEMTQKRKNMLIEEQKILEENRAYWYQQVVNIETQILEHEHKNPKLFSLEIAAHDHEVRIVPRYPQPAAVKSADDMDTSRHFQGLLNPHHPR